MYEIHCNGSKMMYLLTLVSACASFQCCFAGVFVNILTQTTRVFAMKNNVSVLQLKALLRHSFVCAASGGVVLLHGTRHARQTTQQTSHQSPQQALEADDTNQHGATWILQRPCLHDTVSNSFLSLRLQVGLLAFLIEL